jgi:hypothetical protein
MKNETAGNCSGLGDANEKDKTNTAKEFIADSSLGSFWRTGQQRSAT